MRDECIGSRQAPRELFLNGRGSCRICNTSVSLSAKTGHVHAHMVPKRRLREVYAMRLKSGRR